MTALTVRGITKRFGGVVALDSLDLEVRAGEVHALLGQNGSGKSTFVKCLTGVEVPDEGAIDIAGHDLSFPVTAPHQYGIAVIHQDLGLVDTMTVFENLGVSSSFGTRAFGLIPVRAQRQAFLDVMQRLGFHVPLDAAVSTLSPAERALVAVVRAMLLLELGERSHTQQVFVLDEPTASLSGPEAEKVTSLARRMADLGAAVIYISHKIGEVMRLCDSLTVLRGGKVVDSRSMADATRSGIVASMLGRALDDYYPTPEGVDMAKAPRFVVTDLSGERVHDMSFAVRPGEILGVTGLAGMGHEELPHLIFGDQPYGTGSLSVDGQPVPRNSPPKAIDAGIALVPSNRLRDGCWLLGTAEENVTLPALQRFRGRLGLRRREERSAAATMLRDVGLYPLDPERLMSGFSGGNQQKVVFAKWLQLNPRVFLLAEPTQGVDPGAAKDLLSRVVEAASAGASIVVFSGDHEMLAHLSHRVIVLHDGRATHELDGEGLTERVILDACTGA